MTESPYTTGVNPPECGRIRGETDGPESAGNALDPALTPEVAEAGMNDSNARSQAVGLGEPYCCTNHYGPCHGCLDTGHAHNPAARCPAQEAVSDAPDGWDERTQSPVDEQAESLIHADAPPEPDSIVAECECWITPERDWFVHMGAVEPGSQWEPNPDCPVHFPGDKGLDQQPTVPGDDSF